MMMIVITMSDDDDNNDDDDWIDGVTALVKIIPPSSLFLMVPGPPPGGPNQTILTMGNVNAVNGKEVMKSLGFEIESRVPACVFQQLKTHLFKLFKDFLNCALLSRIYTDTSLHYSIP